jgi:chromosome segregation ATPase
MLTGLLLLMGVIAASLIYYLNRRNQQKIEEQTGRYLKIQGEHERSFHQAEGLQGELEKTRRELRTASHEDRKKLEVQLKQLQTACRDWKTEADRVRSQLKGLQTSLPSRLPDHAAL